MDFRACIYDITFCFASAEATSHGALSLETVDQMTKKKKKMCLLNISNLLNIKGLEKCAKI